MVLIPAGEFQMGSDDLVLYETYSTVRYDPWVKPVHTVYIDAFYLDEYEVTVGNYEQFVRETGHRALPDWVSEASPTDLHPVVGVSWYDAMAYATWAGKRLPTEAEWEKAARGGLVGKKYPWGNAAPDGTQCNFADKNMNWVWVNWADRNANDGYTDTAPVGSYPPNTYGLYDMAGNVWEWCLDEWDDNFYASSPRNNPISGESIIEVINNFMNVNDSRARVLRGGSYITSAHILQIAYRHWQPPTVVDAFGFRCARSVTP